MSTLDCPTCKKKAMSNWDKLNLSPLATKKCANCGACLSVPFYTALIPIIPIMALMLIILSKGLSGSFINQAFPIFGLAIVFILLNFVPLKSKK
ncbi:hypothetical protein [Bowmanella pacifica]|nr:hypothetical protein [Bowmanella pacifica]